MTGSSSPEAVSTRLERIAKLASDSPSMVISTLAHHINIDLLEEACRRVRKDGALGVDGQRAQEYAVNLRENLQSLLNRAKSGTYRAPPVRRVHIPKGNGKETRPLGIPTYEDKILQCAVAMVLGAVYEQDFLDCSYGFRPGRSAHQLLENLFSMTTLVRGGWIIEIDIRKYFDSISHEQLIEIVRQRVTDGVLIRLIGKWLNAGVLEHGQLSKPDAGTPQGGVISPLLANIFLHTVLDKWFEQDVKPRLVDRGQLFRYADDAVLVFANESDARRVFEVLPKRFEKYGLALHPDKTRLIEFRRPDRRTDDDDPKGPATFDLLGFTHYWGMSRSNKWVVKRKTAKDRFRRALQRVSMWCRTFMHHKIIDQHRILSMKLRGHFEYFGITGNCEALERFKHEIERVWFRRLRRRSQRASLSWERFNRMLKRWPLPRARITRPRPLASS
jgi:RNA-directed DNA polymerase